MIKNYCEFIGNETTAFDEIGSSRRNCKYKGISHCLKHKTPINEDNEGWVRCCNKCNTPFYIVG